MELTPGTADYKRPSENQQTNNIDDHRTGDPKCREPKNSYNIGKLAASKPEFKPRR